MNVYRNGTECIAQPLLNERDREMCDINSNPLALKLLRCMNGRAASTKWIKNDIAFIRRGIDDTFQEPQGFLSWISKTLRACASDGNKIGPDILQCHALQFVLVAF